MINELKLTLHQNLKHYSLKKVPFCHHSSNVLLHVFISRCLWLKTCKTLCFFISYWVSTFIWCYIYQNYSNFIFRCTDIMSSNNRVMYKSQDKLRLMKIDNDNHWLIDKNQELIVINHHQSSSIVINHHQLSSIVINRHQSSSIIINCHQSSSIVINRHQLMFN